MSGRSPTATSFMGATDGGSGRKLTVDADDVAWQRDADNGTSASLEGCLKLGDEETGEDNNFELRPRQRSKYVTLYRIDHEQQTSKLCSGVTTEECIPCCPCGGDDEEEEEEQQASWIWYLMGSELVLFTLHMSAVVFGVVKEALDLRQNEATEGLHFAHSMVETVATFLVLVIQMLNTRMGYLKVRQAVERLEHFDPDSDAHLHSIKIWMWSAVAAGFVLIGICVGCFIAFYAFVHLGWTVLSNQTCIITSLVIFGLYGSRVVTAVYKINIDQHKVVIYEALMLLKDRCQDTAAEDDDVVNGSGSSSNRAAALRFIEAVANTRSLSRPKYIDVTRANQHHRC